MTGIKTLTSSWGHSWAADKEESGLTGGTAVLTDNTHKDSATVAAALKVIWWLETKKQVAWRWLCDGDCAKEWVEMIIGGFLGSGFWGRKRDGKQLTRGCDGALEVSRWQTYLLSRERVTVSQQWSIVQKFFFFAPPATVKRNREVREKWELRLLVIVLSCIIIGALLTHTGIAVEQTDIFLIADALACFKSEMLGPFLSRNGQ